MPDAIGEPLTRVLLSDQVYARVRGLIIEGALAPGARLVESEIARQFNVSQAPVREAVRRLVHEGLADHIPRRGSFVAVVSQEDAHHARAVRVAIEELAARTVAAQSSNTPFEALEVQVEGMRQAAPRVMSGASAMPTSPSTARSAKSAETPSSPNCGGDGAEPPGSARRLRPAVHWQLDRHGRGSPELLDALKSADPDRAGAKFAAHARGDDGMTPGH